MGKAASLNCAWVLEVMGFLGGMQSKHSQSEAGALKGGCHGSFTFTGALVSGLLQQEKLHHFLRHSYEARGAFW